MDNIVHNTVYMYLTVNGRQVPFITDATVNMWIVMAIIAVGAWLVGRRLESVPSGAQSAGETLIDFLNGFCKNQIGHAYKPFVPFIGLLLLFLFVSNIIAIFNIFPTGETLASLLGVHALAGFELEIAPPTKNFNVTLCLALIVIVVVVASEFRYKGIRRWAKGFYSPSPIYGFIKILDYIVRPMSLCLRLFGNILGGFIVMSLLYSFAPVVVPAIVGVYFDIFDGGLQAYVFIFLTSLYIGEAVEVEETQGEEVNT